MRLCVWGPLLIFQSLPAAILLVQQLFDLYFIFSVESVQRWFLNGHLSLCLPAI